MLHVSVLGEQTITDDRTGSVQVRSARAVALVGFLVVHAGSPQTRQRIAGLFWPDSTDAQALTNLRRELHYLRQVLGDEPSLVVTPRDLCWRDTETCHVDVRTFDIEGQAALAAAAADDDEGILAHATRAIAEYRGDFLPGGYDDWLLETRSALERRCVDLCDLIGAARVRTGDLAGAVDAGRRRIQLQPLEEIGYRTLMRLQADLGDRAGALSTYHHCASVLERELGVVPDPATRQALQDLMAQPDQASARLPAVPPATGRSGLAAARSLAGRRSSACSKTCGRPPRPAVPVWRWSEAAQASARPASWPSSPRWHSCKARWWPAASASARRAAGAGAGGGLAAEPGRPVGHGGTRPGLEGRSRPAGAIRRGSGERGSGSRAMATPGSVTGSSKAWPGR